MSGTTQITLNGTTEVALNGATTILTVDGGAFAAEILDAVAAVDDAVRVGGPPIVSEDEATILSEDGAELRAEGLSEMQRAALAAAPKVSLTDLAEGEMIPGMPHALVLRDDGAMVPYRRVPAAPVTPITGIHVQRPDGSWWEAAVGPDARLADINAGIGSALGTTPPSTQNDGPALDALLQHVYSRYGVADIALPPRVLQVRSKLTAPVRSTIRGAVRPGFDGFDNAAGVERLDAAPLILVDPAIGGIEHSANGALVDVNLLRMGHVYPTDWASLMAVTAGFTGVGLDLVRSGVPNRARNFVLERVGIYGFATGVTGTATNRAIIRDVRIDCIDGVSIVGAGDGILVQNLRGFSWLNASDAADIGVPTIAITGWVDIGGRLGATLAEPADGLYSGMRIGSDKAPLDGFGRCTVDVVDATTIVFRDIPFSADYEFDPAADISYRKRSSSVLAAIEPGPGGLTRLRTEVSFPFLAAGHGPYLRVGSPNVDHPLEARQTIVTAESPTAFVVNVPWQAGFAAIDLTNTDFQLLPGQRDGTTLRATSIDGVVVDNFFTKGARRAAYLSGGIVTVGGAGGSEIGITGEESYTPAGTTGLEVGGVGRLDVGPLAWKTADVGMRVRAGSALVTIHHAQLGGERWALELISGRYYLEGIKSPEASRRRVRVAAAVKLVDIDGGQLRKRRDFVIEGDHRRVVDWTDRLSDIGEAVLEVPAYRLATVDSAGASQDRIVVPASGAVTIDGVGLPLVLRATTTDANPVRLTADGLAATSANVSPLVANADGQRVRTLRIVVTAERMGGAGGSEGDGATWERTITLSRRLNVSTTEVAPAIIPPEPDFHRGGGSAYRVTISADTTNGAASILGAGAPGVNVRFTAQIQVIGG